LLAGLGTWSHPITTKNAEAQKCFDQGLTLMYGFNRPEDYARSGKRRSWTSVPRWRWVRVSIRAHVIRFAREPETQHKNDAIAWVQREFEAAWKGADVELRIGDLWRENIFNFTLQIAIASDIVMT
jgi:hypothetical protein